MISEQDYKDCIGAIAKACDAPVSAVVASISVALLLDLSMEDWFAGWQAIAKEKGNVLDHMPGIKDATGLAVIYSDGGTPS